MQGDSLVPMRAAAADTTFGAMSNHVLDIPIPFQVPVSSSHINGNRVNSHAINSSILAAEGSSSILTLSHRYPT